jgi:hypothetical protein
MSSFFDGKQEEDKDMQGRAVDLFSWSGYSRDCGGVVELLRHPHPWLPAWPWLLIALWLLGPPGARATESVCATVKIEISQELTLERQAFDARLLISNGLATASLTDVDVEVQFADESGQGVAATSDPNNTDALFFIRLDTHEGIDDVSGSGVVAPASQADIHWLIIPAQGAGGALRSGRIYFIGATLAYTVNGERQTLQVTPDTIYVKPLPLLSLDYFLTHEVYADDPFTAEVEPPVPFSLGVRVTNNGQGPAHAVAIDSAQPRIVENQQGLAIDFRILGASVDDSPTGPSLLIDIGDIEPAASRVGRWVMQTSLSGQFTEFSAEFSHADELGGSVTSLLEDVQTHLLVHDVRVDLPGRDRVRDFLAQEADVYRVYESQGGDSPVADYSAQALLEAADSGGRLSRYRLSVPPDPGFVFIRLPDPSGGTQDIAGVVRSDGKDLPVENAWVSRTRADDLAWQAFLNIFDVATSGQYTLSLGERVLGTRPPQIQPLSDRVTSEGRAVAFLVEASDPDGTHPRLSAAPLPYGAVLTDRNDGTALFDWTPLVGQAGDYRLTFVASDGSLEASQSLAIRVNPAWDTDGDGLPDAWELEQFGTLARDSSGDYDGDGVSELDEYLNERDPVTAEGPAAPWVLAPLYDRLVDGPTPDFQLQARTASGEASCQLQLLDETAQTVIASIDDLPEQDGIVSWTPAKPLADNHTYRWRARAFDGHLYSPWALGRVRIDTVNDAPSVPVPEHPADGTVAGELRPLLGVLPATDPDKEVLAYRFALATDASLDTSVAESPPLSAPERGPVRWRPEMDLTPGMSYFWQVTVSDGRGGESASPVQSFTVDPANAAPGSPPLVAPDAGETLTTGVVTLAVGPAADPEGDPLSYVFELAPQADFAGTSVWRSGPVPQAEGQISWNLEGLEDNQRYHWRARAEDGHASGPWVYGDFFVNTLNQPPGVPRPANPGQGAWVRTQRPELSVYPAGDPDRDSLTYEYEIHDEAGARIAGAGGQGVWWRPDLPVIDDSRYSWRVRAVDAHGLAGDWSEPISFFVNDNGLDDTPEIGFTYPLEPLEVRDSIRLYWGDEDADSDASVALYYDADNSGADGALIAEALAETPEGVADSYRWDLSALDGGDYYVYARIDDGHASRTVYATSPISKRAARLLIEPLTGRTDEAGAEAAFSLRLENAPRSTVVLDFTSSNPGEGQVEPAQLTITPEAWQLARVITVRGADDYRVDGDVPYRVTISAAASPDSAYARLEPIDLALTNLDNDVAGVQLSPGQGETSEAGHTASFQLQLTSEPEAPVSFALAVSDLGEARVEPSMLTFTAEDWNSPQTIVVTGLDDAVDDEDRSYRLIIQPAGSDDPHYQGLDPDDAALINRDDDTAGFIIGAAQGPTREAGGSSGFALRLSSRPLAPVRVPLASSAPSEGLVSPAVALIVPEAWDLAQTIQVNGVDDYIDDGDRAYRVLTGPAVSDDPKYAGLDPADLTFTNLDNDQAGIQVWPTEVATAEGGGAALFHLGLTSQPLATVRIALESTDPGEAVPSPDMLVIEPAQWAQAQGVSVYGMDDDQIDGYGDYVIRTHPAESTDPLYAGRDAADVTGSNADDEPDTLAPEITLLGAPEINVELGDSYQDAGASAFDVPEGDLSDELLVTDTVDTSRLGDYSVIYEVSDSAGNEAEPKVRRVHVTDQNLPPAVRLVARQGERPARILARWGGPVTVEARISDVNRADTHSLDWGASHPALLAAATAQCTRLQIDPARLAPGFYPVRIRVSDSGTPQRQNRAALLLQVLEALPILTELDSDGDGLSDGTEGAGDADQDGLADYLDDSERAPSRLLSPEPAAPRGETIAPAHLHLGLGDIAFAAGHTGPGIDTRAIARYGDGEGDAPAAPAEDPAGPTLAMTDLYMSEATIPDDSLAFSWPLAQPLPEQAYLRLFDPQHGWFSFLETAQDRLASAPARDELCLAPDDPAYRPGLTPGDSCLVVWVQDEGPNDRALWRLYQVGLTAAVIARDRHQVLVVPNLATPNDLITLIGEGFGSSKGQIKIGGKAAKLVSWSDTRIQVEVPNLVQGWHAIEVNGKQGGWSHIGLLEVPALHIEQVSPAYDGNRVEILGSGFGSKPGRSVRVGETDIETILEWGPRRILIQLPALPPGRYDLLVRAFHGSDQVPGGVKVP